MKNKTIIIISAAVLVVIIFAILFRFINRGSEQLKQGSLPTPVPVQVPTIVGGGEELVAIAPDNTSTFFLKQGYTITRDDGNPINVSSIQSLKVKHPGFTEFFDADQGGPTEGAAFYFVIWPTMTPGEYVFKIEYKDGTTEEKTINWQEPREVAAAATGEKSLDKGTEYKIGDLDLTSFDEMYYVSPSSVGTKIENAGDKNFWLKDSDVVSGEHTVLIKKEGIWYVAKITI
jgi:hypothetical protein